MLCKSWNASIQTLVTCFGMPFGGSFPASLSFKMFFKKSHIHGDLTCIPLDFEISSLKNILYVITSGLILPFLHFPVPLALLSSTLIFFQLGGDAES